MRHAAQCLGRVLRGKDDYGLMVLADRRFGRKRAQLPKWINQALLDADTNLSTDMAVSSARRFLKTMAQPFRAKDQEGISTWSMVDLRKHQEKMDDDRIKELQAQRDMERDQEVAAKAAQVAADGRESDYEMDEDDEAELMALDIPS
jgi:DNA excision repair protein ERCC-2